MTAVGDEVDTSPGRYRFTVPGLDAGSWEVTLSVSEGRQRRVDEDIE